MKNSHLVKSPSTPELSFYCSSVGKADVKKLLTLWRDGILRLKDGESICIPIWTTKNADFFTCTKSLEALKKGGRVRLYSFAAVDLDWWMDGLMDKDNSLLFTFPGQFCSRIQESALAEISTNDSLTITCLKSDVSVKLRSRRIDDIGMI